MSNLRDSMPHLDFGAVTSVTCRGFGFITSWIYSHEVFFHFSIIRGKRTKALIEVSRLLNGSFYDNYPDFTEEEAENNPDLTFSPDESYFDVYKLWLWFISEEKLKGPSATQVWTNIETIPDSILNASIDKLIDTASRRPDFDSVLYLQLFRDNRISDERLKPLLHSQAFIKHPIDAAYVLRKSQKESYKSSVDWVKIWTTSTDLSEEIEQVAKEFFGPQELEKLYNQRILSEDQRITATPIAYRQERCSYCGAYAVHTNGSNNMCTNCGRTWYVNHCWRCRRHSRIDSRDPGIRQCNVCSWYICASCGACSPDCNGLHR
jgi:hypothetical protein